MKRLLLLAALSVSSFQAVSQTNNGIIEGRVTRSGGSEGISDVQITLHGPGASDPGSAIRTFYTPNPALTPTMRAEIDEYLNYPYPVVIEALATAVRRKEAQLLGLPEPPAIPAPQLPQISVMSDREGRFSFRNLAPGRYTIRARREGYSGGITDREGTITVVAGQQTPPFAIILIPPSVVTGTVRDSIGQPLVGVQVDAFQTTFQNGRETLQPVFNFPDLKRTDDRGQYRLYGLRPGAYRIAATPRRSTNAGPQDNYAITFYPNVVDARTAPTIEVVEGEIGGIDVVIRPDATGRISGKVVSSIAPKDGQNGPAATLYLVSADPKALTTPSSNSAATSDPATGKFEIRGIVPGEYELMGSMPDGNGFNVWGRTRVAIGAGELTGVMLDLHFGLELKVRLTVDGEAPAYKMGPSPEAVERAQMVAAGVPVAPLPMTPVPLPDFRVSLNSAERLTNAPFVSGHMTYEASGLFLFTNVVEGKYTFRVSPLPANGYIADVRAGGRSVFDSELDVNSQTGEVQVLLKTNGGKIQGVVLDSTGKPFKSARVALVPPVSRRQNGELYKATSSDANGSFSINRISPGEYKLFAWETVPDGAWMNGAFLESYEGLGQTIIVGSNEASTELRLIPKERGPGNR